MDKVIEREERREGSMERETERDGEMGREI